MQDQHTVRDYTTGTRVQGSRCLGGHGNSEFCFDAARVENTYRDYDAILLFAAGNHFAKLFRPILASYQSFRLPTEDQQIDTAAANKNQLSVVTGPSTYQTPSYDRAPD